MKKLLILVVASALYLHFYPNEKLNSWLIEKKSVVLSYFSDATDTKVRLKSDKIYHELSADFVQFTAQEQAYIVEITRSRNQVKNFYQVYCLDKKRTEKLHRDNLIKVCQTIKKYSNLF